MMAIYYGKNSPRFDRVQTFNHKPEDFNYNLLIEDYNSMYRNEDKTKVEKDISSEEKKP